MSSDPEAEIRASVGAHADLGPGYEDAVAEGLVERIGAEIDKRIEARLTPTRAGGAPRRPPRGPCPRWLPGLLPASLPRPVSPRRATRLVRPARPDTRDFRAGTRVTSG